MAKEQEKTTIGFSKSTIVTVLAVITVIGGMAFWKDRGSTEAEAATTVNFLLESQGKDIDINQKEVGEVRIELKNFKENEFTPFKEATVEKFNDSEKRDIALQKDQQAILTGQNATNARIDKLVDLQIQQIESNAETKAWIKSIDNID